ncbi:DUF5798 family protein [Natronosalvus halobius]|uniref:DUF5798 family protein n=1 Tax=Natronosalvus halobius TaxID=2953746 RepID=UPI00209F590A|nr:DUF5798 family protein [Natronosalvus halobius]USZ73079.1 DUF5798 family protein [Natronosalvus halobius]
MGLGSTAKKIQSLSDRAEAMYRQVQELQQRIIHLEEEVDHTHDTVTKLDHNVTEQRALLLAIADEHGIDGEQILADAAIDDPEGTDDEDESAQTEGDAKGDADTDAPTQVGE